MARPKKKKASPTRDDAYPKLPVQPPPERHESHAFRETVESIVVAFVLAFLFRTFEAEAFVIPTGSMAPTLMGQHKDVDCPKCGHRYQINSSDENSDETLENVARLRNGQLSRRDQMRVAQQVEMSSCLAGMCPMCRYVMPMRPNLPLFVPEVRDGEKIPLEPSFSGDRILVNKYLYTVADPDRWDVVVFHFPGNAQINYIKRLVGLPGEVIRVYQGDLFVADHSDAQPAADIADDQFQIASKPADKVLAMRQLVHDTNYDPVELYEAGWPLRWQPEPPAADAWQVTADTDGKTVGERYSVEAGNETAWLRYRHFIPSYRDWQNVVEHDSEIEGDQPLLAPRPQLITDFNAYNTRVSLLSANEHHNLSVDASKLGLHWVGDLMVEADVDVESDSGELLVDLVEAGQHFTCTIDLAKGRATLAAGGRDDFAPTADTPVKGPGRYQVALANVDDQLLLWVDDKLIRFAESTHYDADAVFGSREEIIPQTSETDPGDLAPAGVGARDATLAVTRLKVWRDIYYIADSWQRQVRNEVVTDFDHLFDQRLVALPYDPSLWDRFRERNHVEFPLEVDQFFVMGDNSPESSDARLWRSGDPRSGGRPGGAYLERQQLIGKALCVYWPHSWNRIPGTPIPFPLFPNFADMRLVR
jgi:signal peptidase I